MLKMAETTLRYPDPDDIIFNRVISDISVVVRENTITISDSIEIGSPGESEMVRMLSRSTTEITEITRLKIRSSGSGYFKEVSDFSSIEIKFVFEIYIVFDLSLSFSFNV